MKNKTLIFFKTNSIEEQKWYYWTNSWGWGIRGFNTFSMGISTEVNAIAWQEFELAYFEGEV